jgi:hypothetical protein
MASRRVLPFGDAAGEVVAGTGIPAQPGQGDAVERGVGLTVAAAVEPVAAGSARGRLLGVDAAQGGEGGLAAEPVGVIARGDEQGCGGVGADAAVGQQRGGVAGDRVGEPLFQVVELLGQRQDAPG